MKFRIGGRQNGKMAEMLLEDSHTFDTSEEAKKKAIVRKEKLAEIVKNMNNSIIRVSLVGDEVSGLFVQTMKIDYEYEAKFLTEESEINKWEKAKLK